MEAVRRPGRTLAILRGGEDFEKLPIRWPEGCAVGGPGTCREGRRRILLFAPGRAGTRAFVSALQRLAPAAGPPGCKAPRFSVGASSVCLATSHRPSEVASLLKGTYFSLVLMDLRVARTRKRDQEAVLESARELLELLDREKDKDLRYGFHRIVLLVSDTDPDRVDRSLLEFGGMGVRNVIRQGLDHGPASELPAGDGFEERVLNRVARIIEDRPTGPRALCAAGGGITGINFEFGALKCLDDCLSGDAVNTFDMIFGISAGAVVAGLIAQGYSVDEFMASVAGVEGGRLPATDLSLLKLRHVNLGDLVRRFGRAWLTTLSAATSFIKGPAEPDLDSLTFRYSDVIGSPFRSDEYEEILRRLFTLPGATNDFRDLPRKLYVGATDQDARTHVLFGTGALADVPISKAIQASLSMNPVFAPVQIGDRFDTDGLVTCTANFREAIHWGAKLVLVIDPFLPFVSREPGFAAQRGLLYNIDQDMRTITYTRFENTRSRVQRTHPEVSFYSFLPSNKIRKSIAVNPMEHRTFLEVWKGAYLSTLQRIRTVAHRLIGDLRPYGISLSLDRASAVAERLEATETPELADFYPDGKIQIRQPPLSGATGTSSGGRRRSSERPRGR